MIRSMTGFGRGSFSSPEKQINIEIKTVNHRFLDLSVKLPRMLMCFEDRIRKGVQGRLQRGKVDVFVTYVELQKPSSEVHVDKGLAEAYLKTLREIVDAYEVKNDVTATTFLRIPEVITVTVGEMDEDQVWGEINQALEQAIDNLISMRETEGATLKDNLMGMLDNIENEMATVKERAPLVPQEYKEKLETRLETLLQGDAVDPQRLAQEVAFFADKCSVDEEITRMYSHISQFRDILNKDDAVGRKLDFLVQEMNREANTTGSKANDITLTGCVLNIKSEIEKIREQIQNLE